MDLHDHMNLPTAWNINDKSDFLSVDSDALRVEHTGPDERNEFSAVIRANHPVPSQCRLFYYFEVKIENIEKNGIIGIGLCTKNVDLNRMPGLNDNSWGYHNDDGNFFWDGNYKEYGPSFTTGDTIGCYLNFRNNIVFFTKNGDNLGIAYHDLKGILYPCVGLGSFGASVKVNFGSEKFKYTAITDDDIDEFLKKEWNEVLNSCNDECYTKFDELINDLTKSLNTEQILSYSLRLQGKFYFIVGRYELVIANLTKLLDFEPNNTFALRYQREAYYMMGNYDKSKSLYFKILETWAIEIFRK
ncbi:concanavalin A-like lectin/glucanase domain-containing protein [Glomus cerebriforme]|uniref:Concanavalin A-like lectin/glucanase domain-containing protein n=1 Tax=Glomus cerebriforme TaxID=658196 RepID=A0A397SBE1_9GLOM|nr:concanavalin A-like lectin/glucanase domain-containing protein [Glomus cerebriforme]